MKDGVQLMHAMKARIDDDVIRLAERITKPIQVSFEVFEKVGDLEGGEVVFKVGDGISHPIFDCFIHFVDRDSTQIVKNVNASALYKSALLMKRGIFATV